MKSKDLRSLLNRAAAALQSTQELSFDDKQHLINDLTQAVENLPIDGFVASVKPAEEDDEVFGPLLQIQYECPKCGDHWVEFWTSACDSTCGGCGQRDISAKSSQLVERDDEGSY